MADDEGTGGGGRQECILDGKQYAALQEAGREKYEEDVEGCILLFNNQVRRGADSGVSWTQSARPPSCK